MNEKPMLMQSDMVISVLRKIDPKTNTRRTAGLDSVNECPDDWDINKTPSSNIYAVSHIKKDTSFFIKCPYGVVGDRLWIREKQRVLDVGERLGSKIIKVKYEADGTESNWLVYPERLKGIPKVGNCLTYGGYRESSRINLEITDIRVERLQDITEVDAKAEGALQMILKEGQFIYEFDKSGNRIGTFKKGFNYLWNSINEKRGLGWDFNPWVWVVEFKLV